MGVLERMIRLREARRATRKGRFREALDVLRSPPLAGHRDALDLRDHVFDLLMRRAGQALDAEDLAAARDALMTARSAGHEGEQADRLMTRLTTAERNRGVQQRARDVVVTEVRRHVAAGSLAGARQRLEELGPQGEEVEGLRRWVEARAKDLDRYLERCRNALADSRVDAAREAVSRAEALFPTNPEIARLRIEVRELERQQRRIRLDRAVKHDPPDAAWKLYLEAIHQDPAIRDVPELRRFRQRVHQQTERAARTALDAGKVEEAFDRLAPVLADPDVDSAFPVLAGGVRQWQRARELLAAGRLLRSTQLFRAALERIGSTKPLRRELQAAEAAVVARERSLEGIEQALEVGDYRLAAERIDAIVGEGKAPAWLAALRREVGSCLDAGSAALLEAGRLLRAGKTTEARLGLITLLSRKETREAALSLWKEIDARESRAAGLLGRAEAIAMDPHAGKDHLAEARKALEDAAQERTDHPEVAELRERIQRRVQAWRKLEEAVGLELGGDLAGALDRCREGLHTDPTHPALRKRYQEMAGQRTGEILDQAEKLLDRGQQEQAERLLQHLCDLPVRDPDAGRRLQELLARARSAEPPAATESEPREVAERPGSSLPDRFMLRVEEGPEALVLTDEVIRIGNARNRMNHIAVMANISSSHASIRRDLSFHGGVTYALRAENGKSCRVNGERVRETTLASGDEIELGGGVRLRFSLPDPGSATALVEIVEGHHIDDIRAILLLKAPGRDGRIRLGDTERAHLSARSADRIVEIYVACPEEHAEPALMAEADGGIEVDGVRHELSSRLHLGAYVSCGGCRFQIG